MERIESTSSGTNHQTRTCFLADVIERCVDTQSHDSKQQPQSFESKHLLGGIEHFFHFLKNIQNETSGDCYNSVVSDNYQPQIDGNRYQFHLSTEKTSPVKPSPAISKFREKYQRDGYLAEIVRLRNLALLKLIVDHGLSVNQVTNLTLASVDLRNKKLILENDETSNRYDFHISDDTVVALAAYMRFRSPSKEEKFFLVEYGPKRGRALSSWSK